MPKPNKMIYKDDGEGYSEASLEFAKDHLKDLSQSVTLSAKFKADAKGDWSEFNTRFFTLLGDEIWLSGCNVGYKGQGPRTLVKILKLINWNLNEDVVYINNELQVTRELPPEEEKEDNKKKKK